MTYYGLVSPPFLTPEELFCAYAVKVFLTPKMKKNVTSLSFTQAELSPSLPLPLVLSWSVHQRQSPAIYPVSIIIYISKYNQRLIVSVYPGAHLSSASLPW